MGCKYHFDRTVNEAPIQMTNVHPEIIFKAIRFHASTFANLDYIKINVSVACKPVKTNKHTNRNQATVTMTMMPLLY